MKNNQPEMQGLVFILRGNFNPVIFSPVWFASEKLIRREKAEKAETQIVHPDVVSFNLDWLRLQVTRDMFFVETIRRDNQYFGKQMGRIISKIKTYH